MTPFDPVALLVMLRAFYPAVSVAALRRAREERPEYFAGGELFGTHGEKFRLPDGRVFDLIYDVDGFSGGPAWQVIEPGPEGPPDPFPLEPGPLAALDAGLVLPPPLEGGFLSLAGAHLGDVGRSADVVGGLVGELVSAGSGAGADAVYQGSAGAAERALEQQIRAFGDLNPAGGQANAGGLTGQIADAQRDYPDPDVVAGEENPPNSERRDRPPNDGPGSPWYQQ